MLALETTFKSQIWRKNFLQMSETTYGALFYTIFKPHSKKLNKKFQLAYLYHETFKMQKHKNCEERLKFFD